MLGFEKRWGFRLRGKLSGVRGAGECAACFALVGGVRRLLGFAWIEQCTREAAIMYVSHQKRITYTDFHKVQTSNYEIIQTRIAVGIQDTAI